MVLAFEEDDVSHNMHALTPLHVALFANMGAGNTQAGSEGTSPRSKLGGCEAGSLLVVGSQCGVALIFWQSILVVGSQPLLGEVLTRSAYCQQAKS